jgi:large conductance mechanosensitive channel
MLVRAVNNAKGEAEPEPEVEAGPSELDILMEIRDGLKK